MLATTLGAPLPDDPLYPDQLQLHPAVCDVEGAWAVTAGRPDLILAVIDSGADHAHEDLVRQYWLNPGEVDPENPLDLNANGIIDREDLRLMGAGNGIDDDQDGYIDNFSGFDFEDDDFDEDDATDYGHGAGRAGIISAEKDNALGMAGICPGARLMSVRAGDTFVVMPHDLARAVIYAVDHGARVMNFAVGALGNSKFMRDAFAYAAAQGVVSCVSIGNQWRDHNHWPAAMEDVIALGALEPGPLWDIRADYSNFGAHMALSAPSGVYSVNHGGGYTSAASGTSSASPHCTGVAGLLLSRARDLDTDADPGNDVGGLTPGEVRQLLTSTAVDITGTPDGCAPGWDPYTGYGRIHAGRAVARVARSTIPPEADLESPAGFAYIDPERTPGLEVRGRARARLAAAAGWTLEAGAGREPAAWQTIASGSAPASGLLATIDLATIGIDPRAAVSSRDAFTLSIRLRVTDSLGNAGEDRRSIFVRTDTSLFPDFPVYLGSSAEGAPLLIDLDDDGDLEIVAGAADQLVYAFHHDGSSVAGWPVLARDTREAAPDVAPIVASAALGDLDGDGLPEVVIGSSEVYSYRPPDARAGRDYARLYAFHGDGRPVAGWPIGARDPDDLFILAQQVHLILPLIGEGVSSSPILFDRDQDGRREVIVGTPTGATFLYGGDGTPLGGLPIGGKGPRSDARLPTTVFGMGTPAIADLDLDGQPDLVEQSFTVDLVAIGGGGSFRDNVEFTVSAWSLASAAWHPGFPRVIEDWSVLSSIAVGDVSGDGRPEVLVPHAGHLLRAFDQDGVEPPGWPKLTGGWSAPPAIGDLDGDGRVEVVAVTREGYLFVWSTAGGPPPADPTLLGIEPSTRFHHDTRNTGDSHADTRPPDAIRDLKVVRSGGQVHLAWTASGDDMRSGTAERCEARRASRAFGCPDWAAATPIAGLGTPRPSGTVETFRFPDPDPGGPLEVALRPIDESGNRPPVRSTLARSRPLLRLALADPALRSASLPLDIARDAFAFDVASPYTIGNDLVRERLVCYAVPDAPLLRARKSGFDVRLDF